MGDVVGVGGQETPNCVFVATSGEQSTSAW